MTLFDDRDPAGHVRVNPTVIVHSTAGLEHNARGRRRGHHNVPSAIACSRCVRDEIGIDPFDRIADVSGDLRRHKSEVFDLDLNSFGARRLCHEDKKERADGDWAMHLGALLEFGRNVFGVLLMPLKDFQARTEQSLELRIASRRNERVLQRGVDRLVVNLGSQRPERVDQRMAEIEKLVRMVH